jgi:hypothetical protein
MHDIGSFDLRDGSGGRLETGDLAELFLSDKAEKISGDDRQRTLPPTIISSTLAPHPKANPNELLMYT